MSYQGKDRLAARYHVGGNFRGADGLLRDGELAGTAGRKANAIEHARAQCRKDSYALCDVWDTMHPGGPVLVFTVEVKPDGSRVETFGKTGLRLRPESIAARLERMP